MNIGNISINKLEIILLLILIILIAIILIMDYNNFYNTITNNRNYTNNRNNSNNRNNNFTNNFNYRNDNRNNNITQNDNIIRKGGFDKNRPIQNMAIQNSRDYRDSRDKLLPYELEEQKIIVPFSPIIKTTDRILKYREGSPMKNEVAHIGQRKLLLTEVEYLTLFGDLSKNILYVGAASGSHHLLTTKWFPAHNWYLYDKNPFEPKLKDIQQIKMYNEYFTDELAKLYREKFAIKKNGKFVGTDLLYISDIRAADVHNTEIKKLDDDVWRDMTMQQTWIEIMEPRAFMLKFRLPYFGPPKKYLAGVLYIQPWAPTTSTETRLIGREIKYQEYDCVRYEQTMFRHNILTRTQDFSQQYGVIPDLKIPKYDYDNLREVEILNKYLLKFKPELFAGESIAPRYNEIMGGKLTKASIVEINIMIDDMNTVIRPPKYGGEEYLPEQFLLTRIFGKSVEAEIEDITINNYLNNSERFLNALYRLYVEKYAENSGKPKPDFGSNFRKYEHILPYFKNPKNNVESIIFDIGSGTGINIVKLAEYTQNKIIMSDIENKLDSTVQQLPFILLIIDQPVNEIKIGSKIIKPDIITCMQILHHATDYKMRIKNIFDLLPTNGKLIIREHDIIDDNVFNLIVLEHLYYDILDLTYLSKKMDLPNFIEWANKQLMEFVSYNKLSANEWDKVILDAGFSRIMMNKLKTAQNQPTLTHIYEAEAVYEKK